MKGLRLSKASANVAMATKSAELLMSWFSHQRYAPDKIRFRFALRLQGYVSSKSLTVGDDPKSSPGAFSSSELK